MGLSFAPDTGLEYIGRGALLTLLGGMNSALALQTSLWGPRDLELAQARQVVFEPIVLEPIPFNNFFLGHVPSLIDEDNDRFPNCSVMAYRATPMNDQMDQLQSFNDTMYVELMVKSTDSYEVNARIQRTAAAANNVLSREGTLGGTIHRLQSPPDVQILDVVTRREDRRLGGKWYWQGARLEYKFESFSTYA